MLLLENRALLEGFRAGRPEALRTVYLHYQPRVTAFLRGGFSFSSGGKWMRFRGYGGAWELQQAAHETLARAFLPAARLAYDGLHPFGDYLLGIARNYVLNELRRTDRLFVVGGPEELEPAADSPERIASAAPVLEEREVERLLAAFLEGCTPVERRLFELRFHDEKGQEEAAAAMGLTRIQVRRLEYKVKERLLLHLKKHGYLARVPRSILGARLGMVLS